MGLGKQKFVKFDKEKFWKEVTSYVEEKSANIKVNIRVKGSGDEKRMDL